MKHIDRCVDDPDVGLVWDVEVNLFGSEIAMGKNILDGVAKDSNGPAKNSSAIHVHVVQALGDVFWSGNHSAATSGPRK